MNSLMLDKTNPEIAAAIGSWQDGQQYNVSLVIKQVKSDPASATFDVVDVEVEGEPAEESPMPGMMAGEKNVAPAVSKVASSYAA